MDSNRKEDAPVAASSIEQFLASLIAEPHVDPRFSERLAGAADLFSQGDVDGPFLTILVRTQGRRLEALQDALLCLAAQTISDFEVHLLVHDASESELAVIEELVANQVDRFRRLIRITRVDGGGRARPLNVGLAEARGRYVSVFDDDDLLFGNWVEAFADAAKLSRNKMLRANAATQRVTPEVWTAEKSGYRSQTWPAAEYARTFNQFDHLMVNHSPFMSWAFPAALFKVLGVRFDEALHVCEDWDVIVRGSLLMGVVDVGELTSIYRRWEGGSSSYSVHSVAEWRGSEAAVVAKLDAVPMLLPSGTATKFRQEVPAEDIAPDLFRQLHEIHVSRSWRLIARVRHLTAPARRVAVAVRSRIRKL